MKRGLVVRDPDEISDREWEERVETLTRTLAGAEVDVALVYADVSRSDDLAYLTNLCLYWNESLLAVPVDGPPELLTKLSLRVQNWMRRSSTVTAFRGGSSFAALVAAYVDGRTPGRLGLLDAALWPDEVVEAIVAAVPAWEVVRLGALVREQRLRPSPDETHLLRTAGHLLDEAVTTATSRADGAGERVEIVERALRGDGFLDLHPGSSTTGDRVTSFAVTGQYRTVWVHTSRLVTAGSRPPGWAMSLRAALDTVIDAIRPGWTPGTLDAAARTELAALPDGIHAEVDWIDQADLSSAGEFRGPEPRAAVEAGAIGAVAVGAVLADGTHASVAETVRVSDTGTERLTGARS